MIRTHELILPATGILLTAVDRPEYGAVALLLNLSVIAWGIRDRIDAHRAQVEWSRDE